MQLQAGAMECSKLSALLVILMLSVSSSFYIGCACDVCPKPKHPEKGPVIVPPVIGKPPITLPPISLPPVIGKPPITLPPIIGKPPITLPPVIGKPPITLPPVIGKPPITLPPIIGKPPITLPPIIGKPPITLPPVIGKPPITLPPVVGTPPIISLPPIVGLPPVTGNPKIPSPPVVTPGCPPPPTQNCPVDTIKLGSFLDLLGAVVQIGDPEVKKFCPLISGLATLDAAACLCTTIKLKLLNVDVFLPIAIELLIACGKSPPPGYTCPRA